MFIYCLKKIFFHVYYRKKRRRKNGAEKNEL